ncbi:RICIN domain-containing protein [uncultured Clostridium sp.]|jgi:hypothetical protein|uniref:RICIN domain-containing protein n=1 Tax=uncultured Clostridium sp. TaxID=59620 RepID=UPI0026020637|nr:RICIN domain-containing protein [uncultured Clostridium sp.]
MKYLTDDFICTITTRLSNEKNMYVKTDNSVGVKIWGSKVDQLWQFIYNPIRDGYKIMSLNSSSLDGIANEKVLTYVPTNGENKVSMELYRDLEEQYWRILQLNDDTFVIINGADESLALEVLNSNVNDGESKLHLYELQDLDTHRSNSQRFDIKPLNLDKNSRMNLREGIYKIHSKIDSTRVLDCKATTDKKVILFENRTTSDNNQKWNFIYDATSGFYKIKTVYNQSLILTWNKEDNLLMVQGDGNTANQKWIIKICNKGIVIRSAEDENMVITSNGNLAVNLTELIVSSFENKINQIFDIK